MKIPSQLEFAMYLRLTCSTFPVHKVQGMIYQGDRCSTSLVFQKEFNEILGLKPSTGTDIAVEFSMPAPVPLFLIYPRPVSVEFSCGPFSCGLHKDHYARLKSPSRTSASWMGEEI